MSTIVSIFFSSINFSTIFSPSPVIFMASLETKYSISLFTFSGQNGFGHFNATCPSSFISSVLHTGQCVGISISLSFPFLSLKTTFTTCGIISAAFSIITLSPILMSFLLISSKLWRLARFTTDPERFTASSSATGVITPVLPTCKVIS